MMALLLAGRGHQIRTILASCFAFGIAVLIAALAAPAIAHAGDIDIVLDQARLVKLPERVTTVVVGNPLIADATVQGGGLLVITGKGYGLTNLIALDRAGAVLMEKSVEVRGPRDDVVVVHRGVERETYSCAPDCQRRITLGDSPAYFDAAISQTVTRNSQAGAVK
jgi:Flp pilus assembly secretin CpaC